MSNIEIFSDKFYSLPKSSYTGNFIDYLNDNFTEYLKRLSDFNGPIQEILISEEEKIKNLCNKIVESVKVYLQGFPAKSYNTLESPISELKEYLLYPKVDKNKILLASGNLRSYFRIRESFNPLQKEEISHIPFHLRHKTQSYRYSISGLPCLYLSNSLFLCWEELDRIRNKRLYASRFEFDTNKVNLLNLSFTPQRVTFQNRKYDEMKGETDFFLKESIITWPLHFASTIYSKHRSSNFKIEYVIPQLLLQWCKENEDIDGVAYYSTRSDYVEIKGLPLFQENIAFPVKTNGNEGICPELAKMIKITDPIKISSFRNIRKDPLSDQEIKLWIEKNGNSIMNYQIRRFITREKSPSIFDRIEIELLKKEAR